MATRSHLHRQSKLRLEDDRRTEAPAPMSYRIPAGGEWWAPIDPDDNEKGQGYAPGYEGIGHRVVNHQYLLHIIILVIYYMIWEWLY